MSFGYGTTTFEIYRTNRQACARTIVLGAQLYLLIFMKSLGTDSKPISSLVILAEMAIYIYLIYNIPINISEK